MAAIAAGPVAGFFTRGRMAGMLEVCIVVVGFLGMVGVAFGLLGLGEGVMLAGSILAGAALIAASVLAIRK